MRDQECLGWLKGGKSCIGRVVRRVKVPLVTREGRVAGIERVARKERMARWQPLYPRFYPKHPSDLATLAAG